MKSLVICIAVLFLFGCEKDRVLPPAFYSCGDEIPGSPADHPKNGAYEALVNSIVSKGLPGMQLSVRDNANGRWNGALGYADLASGAGMQPCHMTRAGSTVKTFTAATILLLQEEGILSIDEPVTDYLTADQLSGIENAGSSTIRQLLNHSSGIYNYIQSAQFQTASLNDLTKVWYPHELLEYARGRASYFRPGTDVLYSNTNYVLLGMIIEEATGRPFYEVFEDKIFTPLQMTYTGFAATDPVPDGIVRGYVDFYSNRDLINSTHYSGWDYYTADGGLISNAHDLALFLHALINGDLLSAESLAQMLAWQEPNELPEEGFRTGYGLGIFKIETEHGPAYLHSGDAIGYFATMVHFPEHNVTVSWTVNGNYGKLDEYTQSKEAMERVFDTVLD
ncbi:MAG: serine hydrolase domain-containing protein [Cyclobacteriaceae bacterium]